nr:hypothetical protein CFP56_00314 [Quercus suber]
MIDLSGRDDRGRGSGRWSRLPVWPLASGHAPITPAAVRASSGLYVDTADQPDQSTFPLRPFAIKAPTRAERHVVARELRLCIMDDDGERGAKGAWSPMAGASMSFISKASALLRRRGDVGGEGESEGRLAVCPGHVDASVDFHVEGLKITDTYGVYGG